MKTDRELREEIIAAGHKAVEELIKIAEAPISVSEDGLAADKLRVAAAAKKLAILDAFEILNKVREEAETLNQIDDDNKGDDGGFAEQRSKKPNNRN